MNASTPSHRHRRTSLLVVALLVTATVALGAAVRTPKPGDPPPPATVARDGGPVSLSARIDRRAVLAGGDGVVRMEIAVTAEQRPDLAVDRRPTDLVVILDRSGSMHGQKLADARAAVHHLIAKLGPEDRFGLVTFSSGARTEIPLAHASAAARASWARSVDAIHAGGGTYMAPGLHLGTRALERARAGGRASRAILISDGLAAEGPDELRAQAGRAVLGEYALSAVGVGRDFDEQLMSSIADAGTGNYYYLSEAAELARVFGSEFETARETVATALAVTLEPGAGVEVVDAAGYPLERRGGAATFRPGSLFAGQDRRVWVTYRVPIEAGATADLGAVRLEYGFAGERHRLDVGDFPRIAAVEDAKSFFASLDGDAWADGAVVDQYNALRQNVAELVQRGDQRKAREVIGAYRRDAAAMNAAVASPKVAQQLDAAGDLATAVDEAFTGDDAKAKRNRLGKQLHAEGTLDRRVGSRR